MKEFYFYILFVKIKSKEYVNNYELFTPDQWNVCFFFVQRKVVFRMILRHPCKIYTVICFRLCKLLWLIGNEISGSYQKWWLKKQHLFNHNCYLFYILWLWQGLIHCTMWYDKNSVHIWLFDCGMVRLCVKWKWMKGRIKSVVKSDRSFICICVYLHMVILFTANKRAYTHTPTHEYTHS